MTTYTLLIGGSNNGTRICTSDIHSPIQVAKRGQVSVSCDGRGVRSDFETYLPTPVQIGQSVRILHVLEGMGAEAVWLKLMECYNG